LSGWKAAGLLTVQLLLLALFGLPAVSFLASALSQARRKHWAWLGLLLLAALAVAVTLAFVWLRYDAPEMDPDQHYSWKGWYWIGLAGAYAVGLLLIVVLVLRALGRLLRWLHPRRPALGPS